MKQNKTSVTWRHYERAHFLLASQIRTHGRVQNYFCAFLTWNRNFWTYLCSLSLSHDCQLQNVLLELGAALPPVAIVRALWKTIILLSDNKAAAKLFTHPSVDDGDFYVQYSLLRYRHIYIGYRIITEVCQRLRLWCMAVKSRNRTIKIHFSFAACADWQQAIECASSLITLLCSIVLNVRKIHNENYCIKYKMVIVAVWETVI